MRMSQNIRAGAGRLAAPRQDLEGRRVRLGEHVGLVDPGEALDRRAVEADALGEGALELGRRDGHRLEGAEHVGEPQPDEPDVALLERAEHELLLLVHARPSRSLPGHGEPSPRPAVLETARCSSGPAAAARPTAAVGPTLNITRDRAVARLARSRPQAEREAERAHHSCRIAMSDHTLGHIDLGGRSTRAHSRPARRSCLRMTPDVSSTTSWSHHAVHRVFGEGLHVVSNGTTICPCRTGRNEGPAALRPPGGAGRRRATPRARPVARRDPQSGRSWSVATCPAAGGVRRRQGTRRPAAPDGGATHGRPDSVISSWSAATWHGLRSVADERRVVVAVPAHRFVRSHGFVVVRRTRRPDPAVIRTMTLAVSSPALGRWRTPPASWDAPPVPS